MSSVLDQTLKAMRIYCQPLPTLTCLPRKSILEKNLRCVTAGVVKSPRWQPTTVSFSHNCGFLKSHSNAGEKRRNKTKMIS